MAWLLPNRSFQGCFLCFRRAGLEGPRGLGSTGGGYVSWTHILGWPFGLGLAGHPCESAPQHSGHLGRPQWPRRGPGSRVGRPSGTWSGDRVPEPPLQQRKGEAVLASPGLRCQQVQACRTGASISFLLPAFPSSRYSLWSSLGPGFL